MKKIAVILSGCGVYDGAEIHESVLTLFAIERAGASWQCFAPDMPQLHVVNHLTGEVAEDETRNVLIESARIARGNVKNVAELSAADFDAVILPGGFGAAKNLCDFAINGADCSINADVKAAVSSFADAKKPVGFVCIAPVMIPMIYDGAKATIGNDEETAKAVEAMGATHIACPVDEFVIDEEMKIVSTPAYMLAGSISEANSGIERLVEKVIAWA